MRSALDTAALVRSGEASAREVVQEALEAIAASDLGAFTDVGAELALSAAATADPHGPLAGVPVAIKADTDAAGLVADHGVAALHDRLATADAALVRRFKAAGAVIVGTTRMPELKLLPTTEGVRNPWSPDHTPGGSSGGSAAAVAGGLVPMAHGTDAGSSVRGPAACCGLVGLKPSRGRISRAPGGDAFLGTDGILTRTVMDAALALDVLAGYEAGDPTWAPAPEQPYGATTRQDPGPLRIAVAAPDGTHPDHVRALQDTAAVLEQLGHHLFEVDLGPAPPDVLDHYRTVLVAEAAREAPPLDGAELEPLTRDVLRRAAVMSAAEYLASRAALQRAARHVVARFAGFDLLMTPMLGTRPPRHGEITGHHEDALDRARTFVPHGGVWSITGQPAVSVPAGVGDDGLPTAVQLVGRPLAEDRLLQVAFGIEALAPWSYPAG